MNYWYQNVKLGVKCITEKKQRLEDFNNSPPKFSSSTLPAIQVMIFHLLQPW